MPSGAPTISASTKPVRNSSAESKNWVMNSPRVTSCQSRTSVSENGTMKAALVAAAGDLPQRDAGENAEPERRVAADGCDYHFTIALASFQTLVSTKLS